MLLVCHEVLTRIHLSRVGEPDAPVAAITEATKAFHCLAVPSAELQASGMFSLFQALQVLQGLEGEEDQDSYRRLFSEICPLGGISSRNTAECTPRSSSC